MGSGTVKPVAWAAGGRAALAGHIWQNEVMNPAVSGMADANGAGLYYELRGHGPSLLFVSGAPGDAEDFAHVAALLADDFMVLTYDRRGFSRSSRVDDCEGTSVAQQADDAAALLETLGLAPAGVWGSSAGAIIALDLLLRHPRSVRQVMLYEPPLMAGVADPESHMAVLRRAFAQGRSPGTLGNIAGLGPDRFSRMPVSSRERIIANRDHFQRFEFDRVEWYEPSPDAMAGADRPVAVLAGTDSAPFFREAADWLADELGVTVTVIPGGHTPQEDRPQDVAKAVRAFMLPK